MIFALTTILVVAVTQTACFMLVRWEYRQPVVDTWTASASKFWAYIVFPGFLTIMMTGFVGLEITRYLNTMKLKHAMPIGHVLGGLLYVPILVVTHAVVFKKKADQK